MSGLAGCDLPEGRRGEVTARFVGLGYFPLSPGNPPSKPLSDGGREPARAGQFVGLGHELRVQAQHDGLLWVTSGHRCSIAGMYLRHEADCLCMSSPASARDQHGGGAGAPPLRERTLPMACFNIRRHEAWSDEE